ncbi:hypothetical protein J507_2458 [Acinetobacter sp. 1295259]|nr:hypothetical protein J507_2458 [Acinetobacter sp. 1295259]
MPVKKVKIVISLNKKYLIYSYLKILMSLRSKDCVGLKL